MGSLLAVDTGPANALYQVRLLGRAVREDLPLPATRYIEYAIWRRDEDIAETGTEARFDRWHPVLSRELHAWEREHAASASPPLPPVVVAPTPSPSPAPVVGMPCHPPPSCGAAVPEPQAAVLLALGLTLAVAWLWPRPVGRET